MNDDEQEPTYDLPCPVCGVYNEITQYDTQTVCLKCRTSLGVDHNAKQVGDRWIPNSKLYKI